MRSSRSLLLVMVMTIALVGVACGGSSDDAVSSSTTEAPAATTTTTAAPTPTTAAPTSTTPATTTAPPTTGPTTTTSLVLPGPTIPVGDLPGEPIEIFPFVGAELSVFGVRHDDVLNVRSRPGPDGEIVDTLDPTASGFIATGRHQQLPTTFWMEVVVEDEVVGWINRTFAAIEGVTSDRTSRLLELVADPSATSLEELGLRVAEATVNDPEVLQRIEMSVAPTIGDLGEVTYDVVGLGDDASVGLRLHVFAVDEAGDGVWTLRTVEVTDMCGRGGTPGGPCL